jgi:subtilisin
VRRAAALALMAALCATRPAEAAMGRAYFRVATTEARQRIAPFVSRELPGDVVCAAIPPAMTQTFEATPGLTFLGYEALFTPAPIVTTQEPNVASARVPVLIDTVRTCILPTGFDPPVGWGIRTLYGNPNLARPSGGAGIRVAVIDVGVAPHPDIDRRLVKCVNLTPDLLPACTDTQNHGTQVASVIAADGGADGLGMWGMAPEASLYSYRVCDENRECWGAWMAAGIYAAIADGVNIINISLASSGNDDMVHAAIQEAVAHNILVVAAAGNRPFFAFIGYPAVYREVVSVGALGKNLEPWPFTATGQNDGDYVREDQEVEVAAPGQAVRAALMSGCWVEGSGTSLASPLVAGLAARMWDGSAAVTRLKLQRAARLRDVYVAGDDTLTGFGMPTLEGDNGQLLILASAGPGGTVSPSGAVTMMPGGTQTFTITPASGDTIRDVSVDGVSQGPISGYTFADVRTDHTLDVTFTPLAPPALSRPAPNPTTGALRFRYGVPVPTTVRVSVLDLQGREIAVLVSGSRPAGWAWANWDGRTRDGLAPGGVYFVRLQAGSRQVVERFAIVR